MFPRIFFILTITFWCANAVSLNRSPRQIGRRGQSPFYRLSFVELLDYCCLQGSTFGTSKLAATCNVGDVYSLRIPKGQLPKPDVPPSDHPERKEACEKSFEGCCKSELNDRGCDHGRQLALRGVSCEESVKSFGDAYAQKVYDCCTACTGGKDTARKTGGCSVNPGLGDDYNNMFRRCCDDEKENLKALGYDLRAGRPIMPSLKPAPNVQKLNPGTNKCATNQRCHHICLEPLDPEGQVRCACKPGYELEANGKNCKDIDECELNIARCPSTHLCINTPGDFICISDVLPMNAPESTFKRHGVESSSGMPYSVRLSLDNRCPPGYKPDLTDHTRCIDINECEEGNAEQACAATGADCHNLWGTFICSKPNSRYSGGRSSSSSLNDFCSPGLRRVNGKCIDIDECAIGNHNCDLSSEDCINKQGSFICKAKVNTDSSRDVYCQPPSVYQEGIGCVDNDEFDCSNGFEFDEAKSRCKDIDECLEANRCTDPGFECINTAGSYECRRIPCSEDETISSSGCVKRCPANQVWSSDEKRCERKPITCERGYKLIVESGECVDINECTLNQHNCGRNQLCLNKPGSFECLCKVGFRHDRGSGKCIDIDECTESLFKCGRDSLCVNRDGSYDCICKPGFKRDPRTDSCLDINECDTSDHKCSSSQKCFNTIGSYSCKCLPGYRQDPSDPRKCIDIDECKEYISQAGNAYINTKNQTCQYKCHNTLGSFECSCPTGYKLDTQNNRTCIDEDECQTSPCESPDAICVNTHGSFECFNMQCPEGYSQESNEFRCKRDSFDCDFNDPIGCVRKAAHYTYNYLTFPSNLKLVNGRSPIFTLTYGLPADVAYDFTVVSLTSRPNVPIVHRQYFQGETRDRSYSFYAVKPIIGPQTFEVEITVSISDRGKLTATHVVRAIIIVSEYEF